jgi:hypothetical protein
MTRIDRCSLQGPRCSLLLLFFFTLSDTGNDKVRFTSAQVSASKKLNRRGAS